MHLGAYHTLVQSCDVCDYSGSVRAVALVYALQFMHFKLLSQVGVDAALFTAYSHAAESTVDSATSWYLIMGYNDGPGRNKTQHRQSGNRNSHQSEHDGGNKRKRDDRDDTDSGIGSMGQTLALLQQPDLPTFNLVSKEARKEDDKTSEEKREVGNEGGETVKERPAKKAKKIPKPNSVNYPSITFSADSRLQSQIKISDLQNLVLYLLADGSGPQWVSVRHRPEIRKVVVLMVPGLEKEMFGIKPNNGDKKEKEANDSNGANRGNGRYTSPDEYYPVKLATDKLPPQVAEFGNMFEYLWPVKTPGDDKFSKMHSPLHAMLTAPVPKSQEDKDKKGAKAAKEPHGWVNKRTRVTEYISGPDELLENKYTLHPAVYTEDTEKKNLEEHRVNAGTTINDGWVDTLVDSWEDGAPPETEIQQGSITAGREVIAMDCEMCMTGEREFSLTRISLVAWDGTVTLDELVKPDKPIIDYVTQYSGITEEMLRPVTTTLHDIQQKLLKILTPRTILIGHSLNADLNALKLTHPFIIDTSLLYPHPRGTPLKSSLKYLAKKYLGREIQKAGAAGHDSTEDARTCLDLVKQKCEKGPQWGTGDAAGENIFKRLARAGVRYKNQGGTSMAGQPGAKKSAAIDWGDPKKGAGAAANVIIGCKSDEEVTAGTIRAVVGDEDGLEVPGGGVDFVWARFRELEALKGWWNINKPTMPTILAETPTITDELPLAADTSDKEAASRLDSLSDATSAVPDSSPIAEATAALTTRIRTIYDSLPPCTAFIIYSGSGDPREMSRLQGVQQTFKEEFKTKKWDQLSVKWTDVEEQALKAAAREARNGLGFVTVK
ncbi:hypothetical protein V495_03031 [Pseudogymnoascus sp. VKM F-4514 (FW-929)]|nr:hypothetical protein V495_03031 [Pseudogymnoascus sp. VKM F-4514 (FW-929)]